MIVVQVAMIIMVVLLITMVLTTMGLIVIQYCTVMVPKSYPRFVTRLSKNKDEDRDKNVENEQKGAKISLCAVHFCIDAGNLFVCFSLCFRL